MILKIMQTTWNQKFMQIKVDKTDYLSLEGYSFQGFRTSDKRIKSPLVFPRVKVQK